MYLTEISPFNLRGAITVTHQLLITIGILIGQVIIQCYGQRKEGRKKIKQIERKKKVKEDKEKGRNKETDS